MVRMASLTWLDSVTRAEHLYAVSHAQYEGIRRRSSPNCACLKAIETKLFSPRLYETYWQAPEVADPEGICI